MVGILYFICALLSLVNGTLSGFFSSSRGLRHGDSLSALLFVIVMEALNKMILALVDGVLLSGFMVWLRSGGAINIYHLLFVGDPLIFCKANPILLRNLCSLFLCFEVVYSMWINLSKSKLVSVGNVINIESMASILDCRVSSLPMKYLGLLLGVSFKAKSIWYDIIEKVHCRLARWKMYLSKGARVNLIKSTLTNLTTYFMSLFSLLVGNRLEQRDFCLVVWVKSSNFTWLTGLRCVL
jgi:hypothetical protein